MPTLAGNIQLPSFSSPKRRVLSIFRQKKDGPNPSEMDINVFVPAPRIYLQLGNIWIYKEKNLHISLIRKKMNLQNAWLWVFENLKKYIDHLHAYFIINWSINLLLFQKWGETSSSTSLLLVPTSSYYSSVVTSSKSWIRQAVRQTVLKWGVITESLRIQHSTAAQYCCKKESDVTRLVATVHVRNKYSHRVNFLANTSGYLYLKFQSKYCRKLHFLQKSEYLYKKLDLHLLTK